MPRVHFATASTTPTVRPPASAAMACAALRRGCGAPVRSAMAQRGWKVRPVRLPWNCSMTGAFASTWVCRVSRRRRFRCVSTRKPILIALSVGGTDVEFGAVSMGNPHALIEVDDVEAAPLQTRGCRIVQRCAFSTRLQRRFCPDCGSRASCACASSNAARVRRWHAAAARARRLLSCAGVANSTHKSPWHYPAVRWTSAGTATTTSCG